MEKRLKEEGEYMGILQKNTAYQYQPAYNLVTEDGTTYIVDGYKAKQISRIESEMLGQKVSIAVSWVHSKKYDKDFLKLVHARANGKIIPWKMFYEDWESGWGGRW